MELSGQAFFFESPDISVITTKFVTDQVLIFLPISSGNDARMNSINSAFCILRLRIKTHTMNLPQALTLVLCFLLIGSSTGFVLAQQKVTAESRQQLMEMSQQMQVTELQERKEAEAFAKREGYPLRFENDEGVTFALRSVRDGVPEYYMTYNRQAAISTGTNHIKSGGRTGFDLDGQNMIVGEWDGGGVLTNHVEFEGRAVQRDDPFSPSNHATHVAGTLIGGGVNPEAKGMASEATLWAHDWNADGSEMAQAAADGLLVSNHSYGTLAGWARGDWSDQGFDAWHWWGDVNIDEEEDYKFGYYDNRTASWDQISHMAPYYLIVKSAGNNRNDNHNGSHMVRIDGDWVESDAFREASGGPDGFDCLPTYSTAKNILTIGAVGNVNGGYDGPGSVNMTSFSSWGPTDDGRIKPDIVGDGVQLLSANNNNATAYGRSSGTSMSAPNVAGSLILLQQYHKEMTGEFMWSSSLKGLIIHTADDAGTAGPDYSFGWGLLNAESAAEVLAQPLRHPFVETSLSPADTFTYEITSDGDQAIRATLCWTDPAAEVLPPALNDRSPRLVNDLDLRIIATSGPDSGTVYEPFLLSPENPSAEAVTGDNIVDNVEMTDLGIVPSGDYIVQVTHKGELLDDEAQNFSLWITAPPAECSFSLQVDSAMSPPCPESEEGLVLLSTEGSQGSVEFFAGLENRGSDSLIGNLLPGRTYLSAIDSAGCFATTDVVLERPEAINFGELDLVVARIFEPIDERTEFVFSNSFSSGWGGNPAEGLVRAEAVAADDGSGNGLLGCDSLVNAPELEGKIAILRRGDCQFGTKAQNAENAGASACIIVNTEEGVIPMAPGDFGEQVNIPVYMIPESDGDELLSAMDRGDVLLSLGFEPEVEHPTCPGGNDGRINVFTLPENDSVSFHWSTGDSSEVLEGVSAGAYELTITDDNGCEYFRSYELEDPDSIALDFDRTEPVSCPGGEDGEAVAVVRGGTPPYTFIWSSGGTDNVANNLSEGFNSLTITDALGCLFIDSVEVSVSPVMNLPEPFIASTCADTAVGEIQLRPESGQPPFQVLWNDSIEGLERTALSAGNYSFTLTDECGTEIIDTVNVPEADSQLIVEAVFDNPACFVEGVSVVIEPNGGRQPFSYLWSDDSTAMEVTEDTRELSEGQYQVTVTDLCGLTQVTDSFTILIPDSITIDITEIQEESCPGAGDGRAELSASGGVGDIELDWTPADSLDALSSGTYMVSATDENGCSKEVEFTLDPPDSLSVDFETTIDELAVAFANTSISAESYFWDFGDGNTSADSSPVHTYSESGTYEVCLDAGNACRSMVVCKEISVTTVSADPNISVTPDLRLYPNPARDRVRIELKGADGDLMIYSQYGQLMYEAPAQPRQEVLLSGWVPGIYWVQWQGATYRLVVQ